MKQTLLKDYYPSWIKHAGKSALTDRAGDTSKKSSLAAKEVIQKNHKKFLDETQKKEWSSRVSSEKPLAPPRRTIELSPPQSPTIAASLPPSPVRGTDDILIQRQELAEFEKAFEEFQDAEYESDHEDQVNKMEFAVESFSKMASSEHNYQQHAAYFQGMGQVILASNAMNEEIQSQQFRDACDTLQKIQNPDHLYYLDAQYWQGYCLFHLGKLEEIQNDKFIRFTEARKKLFFVVAAQNIYFNEANKLLQRCTVELTWLIKNSSLTHYARKR